VQIIGESKTEAVRKTLEERHQRLSLRFVPLQDKVRLLSFLRDEVWPQIPAELTGTRLPKAEEEAILGYGKQGV
jgi:antitoxin VapB